LLVGVVEQGDQLLAGEGPFAHVGLGVSNVHGGVPLVDHLDRVGAKPLLALGGGRAGPGRAGVRGG
jgi:hypothetical protein